MHPVEGARSLQTSLHEGAGESSGLQGSTAGGFGSGTHEVHCNEVQGRQKAQRRSMLEGLFVL